MRPTWQGPAKYVPQNYVMTEQGFTDLCGKNLRQRAAALDAIAEPRHRDAPPAEAHRRFGTW